MPRILLPLFTLLLVLAGCTTPSTTSTTGVDRRDPAAVNAAWVAAIHDNDREQAMALYTALSPDAQVYNVSNYLRNMTDKTGNTKEKIWPGLFQGVEVLDVREVGAGREAYSKWTFSLETLCYYAVLAEQGGQGGQWEVTHWYSTKLSKCDAV